VEGETKLRLKSGFAKINPDGTAVYRAITDVSGDPEIGQVKQNCAPAVKVDGSLVYVTLYTGPYGRGKLVALRTSDLKRRYSVDLVDPKSGQPATIDADGTAAPLLAPDGTVFYGVLENAFGSNGYRGWLLHFSGDLKTSFTPGAFGWDNTPSIVPAKIVKAYTGTSKYLLFTKYNNYVSGGGEGLNKIALLDPYDSQTEPRSGITTMKEIATQLGPTPDAEYISTHPNAVREWCINSAAVDIPGQAVLANCEDGVLYKWDLRTNTFSQQMRLTAGIGEAYTPVAIGPDGKVYAINNAILFAVGSPTP
jgi:WD40 repeat protein